MTNKNTPQETRSDYQLSMSAVERAHLRHSMRLAIAHEEKLLEELRDAISPESIAFMERSIASSRAMLTRLERLPMREYPTHYILLALDYLVEGACDMEREDFEAWLVCNRGVGPEDASKIASAYSGASRLLARFARETGCDE